MVKVIGVRFKAVGKIYYFDPASVKLKAGDGVIVETVRGVEYGDVVLVDKEIDEKTFSTPLKKVIRRATEKDYRQLEENKIKEREARAICLEKINANKLEMNLIDVEYTFDRSKVLFYFTAEGRVDFRQLVKDLASVFKTRIELRQSGVRDEAKMLGGRGVNSDLRSDFKRFSRDLLGAVIGVLREGTCCGKRVVSAAADGADALIRLDHLPRARKNEQGIFIRRDHHGIELSAHFIRTPKIGKLHCRTHEVACKLVEHTLEALGKRECICNRTGKTENDFSAIYSSYFNCRVFKNDALAHGNLTIACDCRNAILFHCTDGRSSEFHYDSS